MRLNTSFKGLVLAATVVVSSLGVVRAEDMPEMPKPGPEHAWLQQFVGEWVSETQCYMEPGKPPVVSQGTETVKPLGGFWTISEIKGTMMDQPFTGKFTLGYDNDKNQYVGTWIDNVTGHLWQYDGSVDPTGKVLTLEAEGACPMNPGKATKFREVMELKNENEKTFKSYMLGEDGQWVQMMESRAKRVQ